MGNLRSLRHFIAHRRPSSFARRADRRIGGFQVSLTRESMPCNFGEDLDTIVTPSSSTRSIHTTTTKDYTNDRDIVVLTTTELEEFFAYAEKQQQKLFMEKYNFDVVNDMPLTGRYEWV